MSFFTKAAVLALIATSTSHSSVSAFSPSLTSVSSSSRHTTVLSATTTTQTDFDLNAYIMEKNGPITDALQASVVSTEPQTDKICESMLYSLMAGGKRIRPVLCLAACEMFNADPNQTGANSPAMPAAVAVEMIHTMSLIHDDLPSMDNDDLRRGKPTNHVVYGEDVAILAGDALLSDSFKHVAQNTKGVDPERVLDVIVRMGKSVGPKGLAGGQVMDLECEGRGDQSTVTQEDLAWIHTHKTAALLQVSVAAGAILGGATPEEVEACETYALNIGLAFQVADDILDVTQSTEELGKRAGKDLTADKTRYPKLITCWGTGGRFMKTLLVLGKLVMLLVVSPSSLVMAGGSSDLILE